MNETSIPSEPATPKAEPANISPPSTPDHTPKNLWKLVLGCVCVVYGDIGTSPLYALRESLHAAAG